MDELNIKKPSKVQVGMLPALISHKDLIIKDQTGTGKTLGLCIGLLSKDPPQIVHNKALDFVETSEELEFAKRRLKNKNYLSYMVMVPTRELAIQVYNLIQSLSQNQSPDLVQCVFAGEDINQQKAKLMQNVPRILIGTPNRLWDLYQLKGYDVKRLQTLVVDEVDRIITPLGRYSTVKERFNQKIHPQPGEDLIRTVIETRSAKASELEVGKFKDGAMNTQLQLVVSSATVNNPLKRLLTGSPRNWLKKPVIVDLKTMDPSQVKHLGYYFDSEWRCLPVTADLTHGEAKKSDTVITEETLAETLALLLHDHQVSRALVFTPSGTSISRLVQHLQNVGVKADKLFNMHDYSLKNNEQPFAPLLDGRVNVICATEHEARGLDIPDISHVFMIGITTPQSYLHVSGRTGRYGKSGTAITLLPSEKEVPKYLDMIKKITANNHD